MKPTLLSLASALLLTCATGTAQQVTWHHLGNLPSFDMLSEKIFGGLNGTIFLASGYRSDDRGQTWTPTEFAMRDLVFAPDGAMLAATENGIRRSTDNGGTWSQLSASIANRSIDDILVHTSMRWMARSGNRFLRSDDAGVTWVETGGIPTQMIVDAVAGGDGTLYCAAEFEPDFDSPIDGNDSTGVWRSTDAGATWTQTAFTEELITNGTWMVLRALAATDHGTILVGIQGLEGVGGVYRSTNRGDSWSSTTLEDVVTNLLPAPDGTWFASAANSGIYRSADDGRTWTSINSGLLDVRMFPIGLNSEGTLFAADVFTNFYRTTTPVITPASVAADKGRALHAFIHPNPVREGARLSFRCDRPGRVRAAAFDVAGREARSLLDEAFTEGEHSIDLDATTLPAGWYSVRVESSAGRTVLPLVIVR